MSRRSYGTGSLTEVVPGKKYRLRVYAGIDPVTKKARIASGTVYGNKTEAMKALRALKAEVDSGRKYGSSVELNRLLDEFLDRTRKMRKPSTADTYARWINTRIRPALGHVPLTKLNRRMIDEFLVSLSEEGERRALNPATINTIHAILRAALALGVRWDWLTYNPAEMAETMKEKKVDRRRLSDEDVQAIIEVAEAKDRDLAAMFAIGAIIGARRGELCALRWSDLDWETGVLNIERQFAVANNAQELAPLKDENHTRSINVGEALRFFKVQRARKVEDVGEVPADGYIFGIDGASTPPKAKSVTAFFSRCAKEAAVDARLHDLRHYAVSRAIEQGWDITNAAYYFGHSKQVMIGIYSHHSPEQAARLARSMPSLPLAEGSSFSEDL